MEVKDGNSCGKTEDDETPQRAFCAKEDAQREPSESESLDRKSPPRKSLYSNGYPFWKMDEFSFR